MPPLDAPTQELLQSIPHIDQYLGLWAMELKAFRNACSLVRSLNLNAHIQQFQSQDHGGLRQSNDFKVTSDGIAIIEMMGTMTKFGSSFSQLQHGTVGVRRAVRSATMNVGVKGLFLHIDSPGGTAAGTSDLADDVAEAAKQKPVIAFVEDTGASAAYFVASQATSILASPGAVIGSIGTFFAVDDFSEFFSRQGIVTHVISSAPPHKGAGVQGSKITEEQLVEFDRFVNEMNSLFLAAVQRGRGLSKEQLKAVADGRVHMAAAAKKLGLIDDIKSRDQAMESLVKTVAQRARGGTGLKASERRSVMSTSVQEVDAGQATQADAKATPTAPLAPKAKGPASYQELKAACPGASSDFICQQLEANATDEQAQRAFMAQQHETLEQKDKELEAKQQELEMVKAQKPGVDPIGSQSAKQDETTDDPIQAFETAVTEEMKNGKSKQQATKAVVKKNPDLHESYIAAYNEQSHSS